MDFRKLGFLFLVTALILSVSFVAAKTMRPDTGTPSGPSEPEKEKCMDCVEPSDEPVDLGEPSPCDAGLDCPGNLTLYCLFHPFNCVSDLVPFISIAPEGKP
ncbi:MAG: hypothetical protein Q7K34_03130 [archaeon]|nr:hypothetical protein [archaeon]